MRYVVVTVLAAVLLGAIGGTVTHAQQDAKWADVLWVHDGKEWISYVDGMTIPTGMPKFRGNTGDISSVQVALNDKQVGMNELSVGYTFIKGQKTLLQNGTYTLTVRDCGMIVEPPNVGECSLDTADLDDHPILFTGTITINDAMQEPGMVPPPPPELPPTQKEDPIPSEDSTLKDLITTLQKQIKALEDRIADLEAAMFGTAGNETTKIITRTEPLESEMPKAESASIQSLDKSEDFEHCENGLIHDGVGCVPDVNGYHIKVDKIEYTVGDVIHVTGKIPILTQEYETEYNMEGDTILQYVKLEYGHYDGTNTSLTIGPYQPHCKIIIEYNELSSWTKTCALTGGAGSIILNNDGTITTDLNVSAKDYRSPSHGSYLVLKAYAYYGFDGYDMDEDYEGVWERIPLRTQPFDIVPLPPNAGT